MQAMRQFLNLTPNLVELASGYELDDTRCTLLSANRMNFSSSLGQESCSARALRACHRVGSVAILAEVRLRG
jgi:hypothetical protein